MRSRRRLNVELLEDRSVPAAGDIDTTFGFNGSLTSDIFGRENSAQQMTVNPVDGSIITSGVAQFGDTQFAGSIAKYLPTGKLDATFDPGSTPPGLTAFTINDTQRFSGHAVQSNGRIVVAYSTGQLARLMPDSTFDTSFVSGGTVNTGFHTNIEVAVYPDGRILAAGLMGTGATSAIGVRRYQSNGTLDTTFGTNGLVSLNVGTTEILKTVEIQWDGKILLAGGVDGQWLIARLNTNGTWDTSFDADGKLVENLGAGDDYINDIALSIDGKIVAVGAQGTSSEIRVYLATGSRDPTFPTPVGRLNSEFIGVAIQRDGRFLVSGINDPLVVPRAFVFRFLPNGNVDTSFNGTEFASLFATTPSRANAVGIQPNGRIVVSGSTGTGLGTNELIYGLFGDPNISPTTTNAALGNVGQNRTITLAPAHFAFSDANSGDALSFVRFGSPTGGGTLVVNNITIPASSYPVTVPMLAITNGRVLFRGGNATGAASIPFAVGDGISFSADQFLIATVVRLAPSMLTSSITLPAINEDPTINNGVLVSSFANSTTIRDDKTGALRGIAIYKLSGGGSWQYSLNNGTTWFILGPVTDTSARVLAANTTTRIRFVPNANFNGDVWFSFKAWDQTFGSNGSLQNPASGGLAFSTNAAGANMTANTVNDAPVNTIPATFTSFRNQTIALTGSRQFKIQDVDAASGVMRVTLAAANGVLLISSTSGLSSASGNNTATLTLNGTLTAINAALARVSFKPTTGFVGMASITMTTTDNGNTGSGGEKIDTDTLSISISNRPPTPVSPLPGLVYTSRKNVRLSVTPASGVGRAFVDPDGDRLTFVLVPAPSRRLGTLTLRTDGSFTFVPKANVTGTMTFSVRARDDKALVSPFVTFTIRII